MLSALFLVVGGLAGCRTTGIAVLSDGGPAFTLCSIQQAGGAVLCWGSNIHGQIDAASGIPDYASPAPTGIVGAVDVATGDTKTCAVIDDGTVVCAGDGHGPEAVPGLTHIVDVAAGTGFACALHDTGAVSCWGSTNTWAQLGNGTTAPSAVPVSVIGVAGAVEISAGVEHVCARLGDGTVKCWGSDVVHERGGTGFAFTATTVPGVTGATDLDVSLRTTCVVADPSSSVRCWSMDFGGDHITFPGSAGSEEVVAGLNTACARAAGQVRCGGRSGSTTLGIAGLPATPVQVPGAPSGVLHTIIAWTALPEVVTATDLGGTGTRLCARLTDSTASCWGGEPVVALVPRPVGTPDVLHGVTEIGVDQKGPCAIDAGTVRCYRQPQRRGTFTWLSGFAAPVTDTAAGAPLAATDVAVGSAHACAVRPDDTVACWGENGQGQLGDGTTTDRDDAVTVVGITDAVAVETGPNHSCALRSSGAVDCWGRNDGGQLGIDPGVQTMRTTPATVPGLAGVSKVTAGGDHTCALIPTANVATATIACWGSNDMGQFGNGSTVSSFTPVTAGTIRPVDVSAGDDTVCAVRNDGQVACWGDARDGRLGFAAGPAFRTTPTAILNGGLEVDVADVGACARTSGGTYCWGDPGVRRDEALGLASTAPPTFATTLAENRGMAAGGSTMCAMVEDGAAECWGGHPSSFGNPTPLVSIVT